MYRFTRMFPHPRSLSYENMLCQLGLCSLKERRNRADLNSCVPNLKSLAPAVAEILKENPKYLEAFLAQGHAHFPLGVVLWWALANSSCVPNLKSLAPAVIEIL